MRKVPYPHPGGILMEEFLKPMGITQYRLAKEIGVPQRRIGEIVTRARAVNRRYRSASVPVLRHVGWVLDWFADGLRRGPRQRRPRENAGKDQAVDFRILRGTLWLGGGRPQPCSMRKNNRKSGSDMLPEYDFASMKGGVRGKYAAQCNSGTNLVLLDPELAEVFPTDAAVNQALRAVLSLAKVVPPTTKLSLRKLRKAARR